jgi:hypothetical protein
MKKTKPPTIGRNRVSIRVLMPRADYEALVEIAGQERSDISTLVRRAVAHYFFLNERNRNNDTQ